MMEFSKHIISTYFDGYAPDQRMDEGLYTYTVILTKKKVPLSWAHFVCEAENGDHAEEQALEAFPQCEVIWVNRGINYSQEDAFLVVTKSWCEYNDFIIYSTSKDQLIQELEDRHNVKPDDYFDIVPLWQGVDGDSHLLYN